MRQELIFAPMGVLVPLTFIVLLLVPVVRGRAVRRKTITNVDFKLGESQNVPSGVSIPNRNYMNLLEFPVLFYLVCTALYVTHTVDRPALVLAWTFVALRLLHSLMHLTFNIVSVRGIIFGVSTIPVGVIWVMFLMKMFPDGLASAFNF